MKTLEESKMKEKLKQNSMISIIQNMHTNNACTRDARRVCNAYNAS